jgi:NADH-quinone oxidoreductase subunit C
VPHPVTVTLAGDTVAARIEAVAPGAVRSSTPDWVVLEPDRVLDAMRVIRDDPELDGKFLVQLCSVDMIDRIDVVYHFSSLAQNHIFQVKVPVDHEHPSIASIVPLWRGAILQEREVYDLMGVVFDGHPELTRLFLWDKFPGHPLRKDFMALPGGQKSGLSQFPKQVAGQTGNEFRPRQPGSGE